jgi:DNA-binding PadR family transcriptional regulator
MEHSYWLGRMGHGPRGGGFFSRGGGRFGSDDDDFSRGRKFSSDDLQILLLALLADQPRHGYELIKLLEARSNGFYAPSPGMVYPALTYLEELGYTSVEAVGNRKRYALTEAGRAYLDENRERVEMIWAKLKFFAQKMGLVRRALAGEDVEEGSADPRPLQALVEARHKLKQALHSRMHASVEEQLRIAKVLERAASEIGAGPADERS